MDREPVKFGVYIPQDLAIELEKVIEQIGIKSKSKIIQEALRMYINEYRWRVHGKVCGVVGVIYNHEVRGVDEKLTDIQHEYIDIIIATTHVHLDREKCMLAIIVRGDSSRVKEFINNLENIKGILLTRTMLLESRED